jgi:hypothetical protein
MFHNMNSVYFKISVYHLVIVCATDSQHSVCLLTVKEKTLNVKFVDSYNPYKAGVFAEHLLCFPGCPLVEITSSLIHFILCEQNLYFHALFMLHLPSEVIRYGRCFAFGCI